jgi:hypothetical protein
VAALALLPAGSAAATVRYTTPTGSASASCDKGDECSLYKAFSVATSSDEIVLAPGTYNPGTSLLTSADVSLHGTAGQPRPVIVENNSLIELTGAGSTAADLEIRSTLHSGNAFEVDGPSVERVVVKVTPTVGGNGTACVFQGAVVVRDVTCWTRGAAGTSEDALSTGSTTSGNRTSVLRNVTAIVTGGESGRALYAAADNGTTHTLRAFNTIARSDSAADIYLAAFPGGTTFGHTTNTNYEDTTSVGASTLTDNTPKQTAAPVFVDLVNGDLREAPTSPTIDAGLNDPENGATDPDGVPRTVNGTTDIGAYELALAPSAATGEFTPPGTLAGTVNPNGLATSYHFEYGTTTDYGQSSADVSAGAGADPVPASAVLGSLGPKALYHYRLVATNALGTTPGGDATFATPPLAFAGVRVVTRKARVKKRRVRIKLTCPDPSTDTACTGRLKLAKKVRGKTVTVASARLSIAAGASKTVRVKLTKAGRRLARHKPKVPARVSSTDARGGTAVRTGAKVRLLPPKH